MNNELNENSEKPEFLLIRTNVSNTAEEHKEYSDLFESSEKPTQNTQSNSEIYEKLLTKRIPKENQQEMSNN